VFQYSFSLCLVAFFPAILSPSVSCSIPALFAHVLDSKFGLGSVLIGSLVPWMWLVSAIKWTNEGYKTIRLGFLSFRFVSFLLVAPVSFGFLLAFFGTLRFFSHKRFIYYYMCVDGWVGISYLVRVWSLYLFVPCQCKVFCILFGRHFVGGMRRVPGLGIRVRGFMLM